jgi:mannose-6-phosphate isomerase-like protein (cupin superfamily)
MAYAGETLRQGDTDLMVFHRTSADTGGAYVEVEATYASMVDVRPPVHTHPAQDEHFEVRDGTLSFLVEGELREVGAGGSLDLPRGLKHTVWNAGAQPVRFLWRTSPALRTEDMYETLWGLVEDGKMGRHGKPRPKFLQSMLLAYAYRKEYRLASPPYPVLLPMCAVLGTVGRALGYPAHYRSHRVTAG